MTPADTLAQRMRANATLLDMMARGERRLERKALHALVLDLRAWAMELDRADLDAFRRKMIEERRA